MIGGGVLAAADAAIASRILSEKFHCNPEELRKKIGIYERECSQGQDYSSFLKNIKVEFNIPAEEIIKALVEVPLLTGFRIAKSLQGKYKLAILSDQMQFKINHIKQNYDLSFFDVVLFSSEMGVQKPAEEAFQMTVTALQELPEHCLFIDDNLDNVQAAQKLGLKTVHCTNVEILENEIDKILA